MLILCGNNSLPAAGCQSGSADIRSFHLDVGALSSYHHAGGVMNRLLLALAELRKPSWYLTILVGAAIFAGLYFSSWYNYLLFHNIAEIFSILVAFSIFVIAWNARRFL